MSTQLTQRPSGFDLRPANMTEAMDMAKMLAGSNLAPKGYRGQPEDTLVAMMMGSELGLNPIQSLQNIAVINGKPSIYGDALLALVQNHPSFGGIEESFDENAMTASCTVWRKNGTKHTQSFSRIDAEKAALWGKQGPWQQYPKRMLTMRARGFALRNQFADALLGLITVEEAYDMPLERDITPQSQVASTPVVAALPDYSQDKFDANLDAWTGMIRKGGRSADEIIATVGSKYSLSDNQVTTIKNISKEQPA